MKMESLKLILRSRSNSVKGRPKSSHTKNGYSDGEKNPHGPCDHHSERLSTFKVKQFRKRALSSPASDLSGRRGIFTRRHYGSIELLNSTENESSLLNAGRFRIEAGERNAEEPSSPVNTPIHLENPEFQTRWYFKYFLGKLHQTYLGIDIEKEAFVLSVVVTDANNHNIPQYRVILWTRYGTQKIILPYSPNKPQTVKGILSHLDIKRIEKGPKEIFHTEIQKELLVLEEQEGSVNFKIGVIYAKEGQTSDDEFFSNESGSEHFNTFLNLLGDSVTLKDWKKFKAGLDVTSNMTGKTSIYTVFEGHEIMFHVSTLLPFSRENKQQVERKRHIGNDIVNVIYWDGDQNKCPSFKPNMMKTRFTHIYALVTYDHEALRYRINVFTQEAVPLYGPPLPSPPTFNNLHEFRQFLLVKLINGEKAAVKNPVFKQKRERTLEMLIKNLHLDYMPETSMINRRAFSDVIQDANTSKHKEDARRADFVQIGQTLKLKKILKGDAPTSQANTDLFKAQPWEPQLWHSDFRYQITASDSWGNKLVIATDQGTFLFEEGKEALMLFDRTVSVKQLSVAEAHGILIMRIDKKSKYGNIFVFRLLDSEENITRTITECKENKVKKTKGCHLYALSRPGSDNLRMVVAVGRRLLIFAWKSTTTEWFISCPPTTEINSQMDFTFVRELESIEPAIVLSLVDSTMDDESDDNQICVGYKNQFDLINEISGDTVQLFRTDSNKNVTLVSAIDIYEYEEAELLLTYNYASHFQKLKKQKSNDFDIHWNSEPLHIVCAFPYVMAFAAETIEIRLIVNGNLVNTMNMPDLTLISSKNDIYFASSAFPPSSPKEMISTDTGGVYYTPPPSPKFKFPPSPSGKQQSPLKLIYRISLSCLTGHSSLEKENCGHANHLLAPIIGVASLSPSRIQRSPLLRSPHHELYLEKGINERHDSS